MKVVFLLQGKTHYYNLILSKMNEDSEIDVIEVVPKVAQALGQGVYETDTGIRHKIYELEEEKIVGGANNYRFVDLDQVIANEKPAVIVTTNSYLRSFLLDRKLMLAQRKLGTKLILKDHPFNTPTYEQRKKVLVESNNGISKLRGWVNLLIEKKIYMQPLAYVCYIEKAYPVFGSWGAKKEQIFISGNSPDTDLLFETKQKLLTQKKMKVKVNRQRIVHVGRLVGWKKVDLLIAAFARVKKKLPHSELIIIGYGPEEDALKERVKSLGLEKSVLFQGGVYGYEELGQYLLTSGVYVLAGMGGISINDAMGFSLPVVCSRCDGTEKALVHDGVNGFFFKEDSVNDLANKISKILEDPKRQAQMGEESEKIIREKVNIHTFIQAYKEAFAYVERYK